MDHLNQEHVWIKELSPWSIWKAGISASVVLLPSVVGWRYFAGGNGLDVGHRLARGYHLTKKQTSWKWMESTLDVN